MTDTVGFDSSGDASRRAVMGGLVGMGVGMPLLSACGSEEDSGGSDDATDTGSGNGAGGAEGSGTTSSGTIGKTSDVPVGSAKIYKGEKVMISQPIEGQFKAFSTICTHEQCAITKLDGAEIECSCHLSRFKIADGSVAEGPATKPLAELKVTVTGEDLTVS